MHPKAKTIQEMFSRIAPRYDLMNRTLSGYIDQLWRRKAVKYLSDTPSLQPHKGATSWRRGLGEVHVLDLCAGTLDLTLEVLRQNPNAKVTSLDFSEAMLKAGQPKIPERFYKQVTLVVGDGMNLQLPQESYDGVICGFGMRNILDNGKALAGIYKVLKPGGRMITLEFFKPATWFSKLFYATYGKWVIPTLGNWLAKDTQAYQYLFNSIQGYHLAKDYENLMCEAGFKVIANQTVTGGVANIVVGEK